MRLARVAAAALLTAANSAGGLVAAQAAGDPRPPPGTDPGGPAIAIIADGVDYTDPEIAKRLARDGEGEPIAFDFIDGDVRPYASANNDGTHFAKFMLRAHPRARLIVVRVDRTMAASIAQAMVFISRTPAKVAVVSMQKFGPEELLLIEQAAKAASKTVFVFPRGTPVQEMENAFALPPEPKGIRFVEPFGRGLNQFTKATDFSCWIENGVPIRELRETEKNFSGKRCNVLTGKIEPRPPIKF